MRVKHFLLLMFILFIGLNLFASGQQEGQNTSNQGMMQEGEGKGGLMKGKGKKIKRIINNGEKVNFTGTIKPAEEDWIFITDDGMEYTLYLPPEFYLEEIKLVLTDGMEVKIKGYLYLKEVVPNILTVNDKNYELWDEFGVPPWAGTQMGKNNKGEGNS
jgi:hypothetical protein